MRTKSEMLKQIAAWSDVPVPDCTRSSSQKGPGSWHVSDKICLPHVSSFQKSTCLEHQSIVKGAVHKVSKVRNYSKLSK